MTNLSGIRTQRLQPDLIWSAFSLLTAGPDLISSISTDTLPTVQRHTVLAQDHECAERQPANEEPPGHGNKPEGGFTSPGAVASMIKNEEAVITGIRATDLTLSLGRRPDGFHALVHHSGTEWRTENKPVSMNSDVIECSGPVPIPPDLSASVYLGVKSLFECRWLVVLGDEEQLQKLTITVERLLDNNAKQLLFTSRLDGDVVPPCSSLLVVIERQDRGNDGLAFPEPHRSASELRSQLVDAINSDHSALSCHRKHKGKWFEDAVEQFQHALNICPAGRPCHPVALSDMAIAKSVRYRIYDVNASLQELFMMYSNALATRPIGHPCHPCTLIWLAMAHFSQFKKQRDEGNAAQVKKYLREVVDLGSEACGATLVPHPHERRMINAVLVDGRSSVVHGSALGATEVDLQKLGSKLLRRYERFGDLADLQEAISCLEIAISLTSASDCWYWVGVGNLGIALWFRFNCLGELGDLEDAISRQQDAVDLTPAAHPYKPGTLNNLGICFRTRFEHLGQPSDLKEAISWQRAAVDLTQDDHPDKPDCLSNLGNSFFTRFKHLGQVQDLEEAISQQRDAVHLTPDAYLHRPGYLNNLSVSLLARFNHLGQLRDLEEAILWQRAAVDLTPDDHPGMPDHLTNLGISLFTCFWYLGRLHDLEEAILWQRNAVNLIPDTHPGKPGRLNNLSICLRTRCERLGQLCDLEEAISMQQVAVNLIPDDHSDKPGHLNSLGNSLVTRFKYVGHSHDLEGAISRQRDAVHLTPDDHPDKPRYLNNLGVSFLARFEHLGQLHDLEEAILWQREAVDLAPDAHPDKLGCLSNLGSSLRTRFERRGQLHDLEEAISMQRDAVHLTLDAHPGMSGNLNNLGISLHTRFKHLGRLYDLEDAISRQRDAVNLTPDIHPDKPGFLNNLGISFRTRFEHFGQLHDLEEAILWQQNAVDLIPDAHPDKPGHLNNLGICFRTRFERLGQLCDLEAAISLQRVAVDLVPDGHPIKPGHLNSLGNSLVTRFKHLGRLCDLEEAISWQRNAVNFTPYAHPEKSSRLNNLGNSFLTRFTRLGQLHDLEEAISRQQDAVDFTPDDHPDTSGHLNNLGVSFLTRFEHLGQLRDLEEAISRQRNAVHLTADTHPGKPGRLNNLGTSFRTRFEHLDQLNDLEEAILHQRNAVNLAPDVHPDKPGCLNNLGVSLLTRFKRLGQLPDLDEAVSQQSDAVRLITDAHPDKPGCLSNLGVSLLTRFDHLRQLCDLEDAISRQRDAVHLTPDAHPDKPAHLTSFGNFLLTRFKHIGKWNDIEQAFMLYSNAARASTGPIAARFQASRKWIFCARLLRHPSLLSAYSVAIHLLPQLAWIGLPLAHRYRALIQGSDVVREAAAVALESGRPETAVEWLEQGRSIVWGELLQLRSSYDELSSGHPDYASRLRELSVALEQASAIQERILYSRTGQAYGGDHRATESLQQEADKCRVLAIERDKLLQDIRTLPGFERFLLHKEFSQLRVSAQSGPVVILNAAETRCDALIVVADVDHVIHVPLPDFALEKSKKFQSVLKRGFVRHTRGVFPDERYGHVVEESHGMWETHLASLWTYVVRPVLDALALSATPGDLSRIFWCPTGPLTFLPIHAAGLHDAHFSEPGHKVFDFVISSYVPTLSILASSPKSKSARRDSLRLLAVRQPPSDGQSKLPGVHAELENIKTAIKNSSSTQATLVEPSTDTVEEVLDLMKKADWVHFACHGVQDSTNPTDSGLCLANERRLRISDVIALSRAHGGLAFLSACQTAKGDDNLSDEAIHIAAGMLFAGYGGVVGTMWSISDKLAPDIARDVYGQLFRNGETTPDYRDAARALHVAVGRLRERKVPFKEWLPFIHLGL